MPGKSQQRNTSQRSSERPESPRPATALDDCLHCGAKCCHDLVRPINKPRTADDVDEMKWELQYDVVRVFIRSHRWYRIIHARCLYLDDHDRCTIYDRRHWRCRQMKPPECEHFGDYWEVMISTPEDLDAHLANGKLRRK